MDISKDNKLIKSSPMEDKNEAKPEAETKSMDNNQDKSDPGLTSTDTNDTTNKPPNAGTVPPAGTDTGSNNPKDSTVNAASLPEASSGPSPLQNNENIEPPSEKPEITTGSSTDKTPASNNDTNNYTHVSNKTSANSDSNSKGRPTNVNGQSEPSSQKSDTSTGPSTYKIIVSDSSITNDATLINETPVLQTQTTPIHNRGNEKDSKADSSSLSVSVQNEDVEKKRDTSNSEPTLKIDPGQSSTNGISSNHQVKQNGQKNVVGQSLATDVPIASRLNERLPQQARVSGVADANVEIKTNEPKNQNNESHVKPTLNVSNGPNKKVENSDINKETNESETGLNQSSAVQPSIESNVGIANSHTNGNATNDALNTTNHTITDEIQDSEPEQTVLQKTVPENTTEELRKLLLGQCSFNDLLPLPKKNVRIFVSSTFTGISTFFKKNDNYLINKHIR